MSRNSLTDKEHSIGFENVAKSVGTRLALITINNRGEIVKRIAKMKSPRATTRSRSIPLPEDAVAVGQSWSFPMTWSFPATTERC